jgi:bifunctional non-homologous end joining protein LigD
VAKRASSRKKAETIEGARPSEMPGFIKPQLATLKSKAPHGKGKRKVYTRNGLDWTKRFSAVAGAIGIPGQAILDGEVVVIKDGRTNFSELQAELAAGNQARLVFYAFDLLYLTRPAPLAADRAQASTQGVD